MPRIDPDRELPDHYLLLHEKLGLPLGPHHPALNPEGVTREQVRAALDRLNSPFRDAHKFEQYMKEIKADAKKMNYKAGLLKDLIRGMGLREEDLPLHSQFFDLMRRFDPSVNADGYYQEVLDGMKKHPKPDPAIIDALEMLLDPRLHAGYEDYWFRRHSADGQKIREEEPDSRLREIRFELMLAEKSGTPANLSSLEISGKSVADKVVRNVDFSNAILPKLMTGCRFENCIFDGAHAEGVRFNGSTFADGTRFVNVTIDHKTSFIESKFENAVVGGDYRKVQSMGKIDAACEVLPDTSLPFANSAKTIDSKLDDQVQSGGKFQPIHYSRSQRPAPTVQQGQKSWTERTAPLSPPATAEKPQSAREILTEHISGNMADKFLVKAEDYKKDVAAFLTDVRSKGLDIRSEVMEFLHDAEQYERGLAEPDPDHRLPWHGKYDKVQTRQVM